MLLWLGCALLLVHILIGLEVVRGARRIDFLRDIPPSAGEELPTVSLIAAARDEERNLQAALESLLALDYPALQLILVNDRSRDLTGRILDTLAARDPRLEVVHLQELPAGWLGKNHALWEGSRRARGDLLLFTDADVLMAPDTLRRAVHYLQSHRLDHLAATPETRMSGRFLNLLAASFGFFLGLFTRPWLADDPSSACHIGIGAFNLVRAVAYRDSGGHQRIALRPDDDLKLGKILKQQGYRQRLVYGDGFIGVEWYASVREMVVGLEKNVFAGFDYQPWRVLGAVLFLVGAVVWPYLALFLTSGATLGVYAVGVILLSLIVADGLRLHGYRPWQALGFAPAAGLLAFIFLRAMILNLVRGGITWRGTFYPLDELRRNRV